MIRDTPQTEYELLDQCQHDLEMKLFDGETPPIPPDGVEEGVSERGGSEMVDLMDGTVPIDDDILGADDGLVGERPPSLDLDIMEGL